MYKRGENLKETLSIDMTKIREKNTNWYATILGFFRDEDTENEQDSGYEEWKKENADIINLKENNWKFIDVTVYDEEGQRKFSIFSRDDKERITLTEGLYLKSEERYELRKIME